MDLKNRIFGKQNEKGAVTIEATLALTTFLFVFLTIYSIITVCRTQARVQVAINNTAKEISQYSYLYGLSGLDESLKQFQDSAGETKDSVNGLVSNVIGVFDGIQSLGEEGKSIDLSDPSGMLDKWDDVSQTLDDTKGNFDSAKQTIEEMAENPQQLLFGMAKLIGSESLEIAKSRAIAEPVSRALIRKHLKRSNNDTAEAFCADSGIVPGTYFGKESYFNGIDFSNSTLFPYGSDEIKIVAAYKVKLMQLLPIDVEFSITQTAITKGWLHGDKGTYSDTTTRLEAVKKVNGQSIWNSMTTTERSSIIRSDKIDDIKAAGGYYNLSGSSFHLFEKEKKQAVMIKSANPVYGMDTTEGIDKDAVKKQVLMMADDAKSSADNQVFFKIKTKDKTGKNILEEVDCSKTGFTYQIVLVVPEDEGIKELYESVIAEVGLSHIYSVEAGYGTGLKYEPEEKEGSQ